MRTKIFSFCLLLSTLGFMSFIPDAPISAMPDNGATVTTLPIDFFITICSGEYVEVHGTVHITSNYRADHKGGMHIVENQNVKAEGIGSFGNKYMLNYAENFKHNIGRSGFPVSYSNPVLAIFVGKGSAPNLKIKGRSHITINHHGVVTAGFEIDYITCK